tara:strand:- start:217 stop:435 length:219 start_codon:yes stop_codon:yes gene_type:complete
MSKQLSQPISGLLNDVKGYVSSMTIEHNVERVGDGFGTHFMIARQHKPATITIEQGGKTVTFMTDQNVFREL